MTDIPATPDSPEAREPAARDFEPRDTEARDPASRDSASPDLEPGDFGKRDPREILREIERESARAKTALAPNVPLLYSVWGAAWLLGFTALFVGAYPVSSPALPLVAALSIAGGILVAAIAVSAIHSVRRGSGARGPSVVQGAILGNSYTAAFLVIGLLGWRLHVEQTSSDAMVSYWVAAVCLVIGLLSVVGSLLANDRPQLVFGAWTLVVGLASTLAATPYNLLVGAIGGVGFVMLAVLLRALPQWFAAPVASRDE